MKILIANRGEIAVRIIRACREMGIPTVAVYSDCDRDARHVREADQAVHIGPSEAARELPAHRRRSSTPRGGPAPTPFIPATASSPRTPRFARACRDAGLTFIGPSPEVDRADGQQDRGARRRRSAPACRSCPGTEQPFDAPTPDEEIAATAARDRLSRSSSRRSPAAAARACASSSAPADLLGRRPDGALGSRGRVRRHERLPRAPHRPAAAHRDPAARRSPRHGRAVRRARVLDPAAPSEGRRGVAVDRRRRRRCAARMAAAAAAVARRSATPTPARSSSCSTRTARSTSSR